MLSFIQILMQSTLNTYNKHKIRQLLDVQNKRWITLYIDIVKEMIKKQSDILKKVNDGDYSDVCYFEGNGLYGIYDKNYTKRLRLVYYILFENIDNEDIVKRLFEEELKDRETNSFQGIGSSLEILTYLLMKHNDKNKYDELFKRAKNANFDCACGYSRNLKIE